MSAESQINEHLLDSILTRYIGQARCREGRDIGIATLGLWLYVSAPDYPARASIKWPPRLRQTGTERLELAREWDRLRVTEGIEARFSRSILDRFWGPSERGALACLVADGPGPGGTQIELALHTLSQHEVRPTRARPEGGRVSPSTVRALERAYKRLMQIFVDLATGEYPCEAIRRWDRVPRLEKPDVAPVWTDRSAPSFRLVRRLLWGHDREIKRLLRARDGDERAALDRCGATTLRRGLWRLTRRRALLAIATTVGPRVGALARLRVCDYDPNHRFADGTGHIGPALQFRPGKVQHEELARWKGLTPREAEIIEVHLRVTERMYLWQRHRVRPDGPTDFPAAEAYLFSANIAHPERPPHPSALSRLFAGTRDASPLVPRYSPEEIGADPSLAKLGYSAHTLRHRAYQDLKRTAVARLREEGIVGVSPEAVVAAVLDHEIRSDLHSYGDIKSEQGRERWARFGIEAVSRELWTRRGARLTPNVERFEAAVRSCVALRQAHRDAVARLAELHLAARRKGSEVAHADVAGLLGAIDEERRLHGELQDVQANVERLRDDRSTYVELPEDAPEGQEDVDLNEVEKTILNGRPLSEQASAAVRNWVSVLEFSRALGISIATARRWVTGSLPFPAGDARNPWEKDSIPVDESRGARRRRIWLGGIKPSALTAAQREALFECTFGWPQEANWSHEDCAAELKPPCRRAKA